LEPTKCAEDPAACQCDRRGRRRFLALAGSAAGAVALVACSEEDDKISPARRDGTATPPAGGVATATPDPALRRFLLLSAAITGVEQLDPAAGQRYLTALQTPPSGGMALTQLYDTAGIAGSGRAPTLAELEAKGLLGQPAARITIEAIATYWYSGQLPAAGGDVTVVTYNRALGWQALGFAVSPGHCAGQIGFWTTRPA
jgi:hypothetical protein